MKTPEERGPLGAWAYDSRDRLGLSVEQVALALPSKPNPATIRKAESNSENMSRPLWRALTDYYRQVALEQPTITLDPMPSFGETETPTTDYSEVVKAIDRQTEMLKAVLNALAGPTLDPERQAWARQQRDAIRRLVPTDDPAPDTVR